MKAMWLFISLIPAPFFMHYMEYVKEMRDVSLIGSITFVVVAGILSAKVRLQSMFLIFMLTITLSVLLAKMYIPEGDGWFKPFTRDGAVIAVGIVYFLAQHLTRGIFVLSCKKVDTFRA